MKLFLWNLLSRGVANTRSVSLRLLVWHTRAHYWATRKAADANLRTLNRRAMQRGIL